MCKVSTPEIQPANAAAPLPARFTGNGKMRIVLNAPTSVSTRIVTLSGREVFRSQEMLNAGDHTIGIKTSGLGHGAYIVLIKYGTVSNVRHLIVER